MGEMTWELWIKEVANLMGVEVEDVLEIRDTPRQLYVGRATPSEAADFLRLYC